MDVTGEWSRFPIYPFQGRAAASLVPGVLCPGSQVQQRGRKACVTPGEFGWVNWYPTTPQSTATPHAALPLGRSLVLQPSKCVTHGASNLLKELNLFHFLNCSWEKIRSH